MSPLGCPNMKKVDFPAITSPSYAKPAMETIIVNIKFDLDTSCTFLYVSKKLVNTQSSRLSS